MQPLLIITVALHVLTSIFWAGTTFVLARTGGADAARLFRPQIGAAVVAIVSGAILWHLLHDGDFGRMEMALAIAAGAAVTAFVIQAAGVGGILRRRQADSRGLATAYRISAGLLMVTAIGMASARYV
jgi:hypothetical protein